ncbi:hypothetical protein AC249_AIPGENE26011 [Exaiptasia diaphana]|nr:hypothetical protein AC249_AIPGENE26011 [Exaiptasia diaphana]
MMDIAKNFRRESELWSFLFDPVEKKRAYIRVNDMPYEMPSASIAAAFKECGKVGEDNDGVERTEQDEMLDVVEGFYRDLFTKEEFDVGVQDDLLEKVERVLSDEERQSCEGMLSVDELNGALVGMSLGKAPGEDGLPVEFYRCFSDLLLLVLCKVVILVGVKSDCTVKSVYALALLEESLFVPPRCEIYWRSSVSRAEWSRVWKGVWSSYDCGERDFKIDCNNVILCLFNHGRRDDRVMLFVIETMLNVIWMFRNRATFDNSVCSYVESELVRKCKFDVRARQTVDRYRMSEDCFRETWRNVMRDQS